MKIYTGLLILLVTVALSGCTDEGKAPSSSQMEDEYTPLVIGEKSGENDDQTGNEPTTGTVTIEADSEDPQKQEKPLETLEESKESRGEEAQGLIVDDWTWKRDGGFTEIHGSLENTGKNPIGFFRIKAEYVNESGEVVDVDTAVHGEVVWPGHQKRFDISHAYDKDHKSVRIWVDEVKGAKEPVIYAADGLNAEIVEGWTWERDGPFSYIQGKIRNTGEKNIRYYKIMAEYGDGNGKVLDSDFTNSNDVLEPGQEMKFRIMHPYSIDFQEVTIYISRMN